MGNPAVAKIKVVFNQVFTQSTLYAIKDRSLSYGKMALNSSQRIYGKAEKIYKGPIRNFALVTSELIQLISKERHLFNPSNVSLHNAMSEYKKLAEKVVPTTMRTREKWFAALQQMVGELTWKQVGEGALVVGEVISLYYISKLVFKSGRKTLAIFA